MSQMTKFNFHGDELEVCGTCPEDAEVSIRRVCESLGVSTQGQLKRLASKPWACINQKLMQVAGDNQPRHHAMISLKSLPLWLATIEPRKVKEHVREKLVRYQRECADVLAAHFLGIGKPASGVFVPADVLERIVGRQEHLQQQIDRFAAALPQPGLLASRPQVHALPQATVQDRLRHLGWPEASAKQRERVRRRANAWLMLRFGETPDVSGGPGGGGPCVYHGHQITVLDEAVRLVRAEALAREEARERVTGPTLFSNLVG